MIKIIQFIGFIAFTGFLNFAAAEPRLIHIESSDGLSLSAIADIPTDRNMRMPAVIFLHQGSHRKKSGRVYPFSKT